MNENVPDENLKFVALRMVVLSLVLHRREIPEGVLWILLKKIGLSQFLDCHPDFGNLKHYLQRLVSQMYLEKKRAEDDFSQSQADPTFNYTLGTRAFAEIGVETLYTFMSKVIMRQEPDTEMLKEVNSYGARVMGV